MRGLRSYRAPNGVFSRGALLAGAACSALGASVATAQQREEPETTDRAALERNRADVAEGEEEIVVVGTALPRGNAIAPVIIITPEDIERSGALTINDLLRTLPQNSVSGVSESVLNNSNVGRLTGNDSLASAPNLRGLGSRYTVSLVNGHRVALGGREHVFDVSQIPFAAINRIEILTDSASAIYGADAIGGVLNFVLKDDFSGADASASFGAAEGGYEQQLYNLTIGGGWNIDGRDGSVVLSYEYFDQNELTLTDRPYLSTLENRSLAPEQNRNSIFFNLSQEFDDGLSGNVTGFFTRRDGRQFVFFGSNLSETLHETQQWSLLGSVEKHWSESWRTDLTVTASSDDFDTTSLTNGVTQQTSENPSSAYAVNLTTSGETLLWSDQELRLAFGGEYRRESFATIVPGFASLQETRHRDSKALFVEARTTLFGDVDRGSGFAEISAALRWDEYSDIGRSTNPQIGLRWVPTESIQLSATWGTGFRAPSLFDLYGRSFFTIFPANFMGDSASPTGLNPAPIAYVGGSSATLRPEESESYLFSVDWTPTRGLKMKLTYYNIQIENAVLAPSVGDLGDPALSQFITRLPTVGQLNAVQASTEESTFFDNNFNEMPDYDRTNIWLMLDARLSNFATYHVDGVDFDASYEWDMWRGTAVAGIAVSYIDELTLVSTPGERPIDVVDTPVYPTSWRVRGTFGLDWEAFNVLLTVNYVDGYINNLNLASIVPVESWTTADLQFGFNGSGLDDAGAFDGVSVGLVIRNITDERPPTLTGVGGAINNNIGFDPANANPFGRMVTLQMRKRF